MIPFPVWISVKLIKAGDFHHVAVVRRSIVVILSPPDVKQSPGTINSGEKCCRLSLPEQWKLTSHPPFCLVLFLLLKRWKLPEIVPIKSRINLAQISRNYFVNYCR